jgi:anti-sigma regulatory factor (Ser/Thr protein kinase)
VLLSGSTLVLFTDGLIERKHESIDDGLARVADVLEKTANLPVAAVADEVLRNLAPAEGYDDDVAMVVYRHQQAPLRIESDATADQLAIIRHRLSSWLKAAAVPDALVADIVLVVNEACTNSVEHAYRGHDVGTMRVEVESLDGQVHARITDSGSWKTPGEEPSHGGRGMLLVKAVSDTVEIDCGPTGTTVEAHFRLPTAT